MSNIHARSVAPWRAGHPVRTLGKTLVLLVTAAALLNLAGCSSDDPAVLEPPSHLSEVIHLAPEPEYTAGAENTVSWTVADAGTKAIPEDWFFLAQRSTDPTFESDISESSWVGGDQHTFEGLTDAVTSHYRVKARNGAGLESEWSATASTTQDAVAPVAEVLALLEDQTSLLFNVEVSVAEDVTSGVAQVELWYSKNGGDRQLHGVVEPGIVSFQTDEGGPHEFVALATDAAGNAQVMPTDAQANTLVPEPIILIDNGGYEWDITNAVLKHRIALPWWEFGLGRFTIRPAVEPRMIGPGEVGYPDSENLADVVAVDFEGDVRAYKIGDLSGREVADDVVNGVPMAATY